MAPEKQKPGKLSMEEKVRLFQERFVVRRDVFNKKFPIGDGKSSFMPVCSNQGNIKLCRITQGTGGCYDCSNRSYAVLDDSYIRRHIMGQMTLCLMPLTAQGIRMGAIDLDMGMEEGLESIFKDAILVRNTFRDLGMEPYIARSSNKGYHLYFWFSDFIPAEKFTSIAYHVLYGLGFGERWNVNPRFRMPEIFPKQLLYDPTAVGNGIRVPLSEPDVRNGRNCFVDDDAKPFPLDAQWEKMVEMKSYGPEVVDKIIADHKIDVKIDSHKTKKPPKKKIVKGPDGIEKEVEVAYVRNQYGSFWNVVAACPAMQEYWGKDEQGKYRWDAALASDGSGKVKGLFHNARYASMSIALATTDGEKIIRERWTGAKTDDIINQAKGEGYSPTTCKWMQDSGVCLRGKHPLHGGKTYCFKKMPPTATENGKIVTNPDNLPEEEWPEPSPIRHAGDSNLSVEEICSKLSLIVGAIRRLAKADKGEPEQLKYDDKGHPVLEPLFSPDSASDMLNGLFRRIAKLPADERERVADYVVTNKLMSKTEWNQKLKSAGLAISKEKEKTVESEFKSFSFKGRRYVLKDGKIISMFTDQKGVQWEEEFSNFWIERLEEPATIRYVEKDGIESVVYEDRTYKLVIHCNNQARPVSMPNRAFSNAATFFEQIRAAGGTDLLFSSTKDSYDIMLAAISAFSDTIKETHALRDIGYLKSNARLKGGTKYIMPSVVVTADEIISNDAYIIEMVDDFTKGLDFQIIGDDKFKEVSRHIVSDLFNCNNSTLTMTCFAHAMASVCTEAIGDATGWRKAPVLWLAGDYSGGKSFVLEHMQCFFGNFANGSQTGAGGSFKAKVGVAHAYRHAFLGYDDHKDTTQSDRGRDMIQFVQEAYDRKTRPALSRSGAVRTVASHVRGLVGISGEDFPDKEASAVSRLVLVDVKMAKRREEGGRVKEMCKFYSGFTPYVVRHILRMPKEMVAGLWKELYDFMYEGSKETDEKRGASRVCENLALNLFGFQVAVDAMVAGGGISPVEAEQLIAQHRQNLRLIKANQTHSVSEARASEVFMSDLGQLLADPKRYRIHGWKPTDGDEYRHADTLGFWVEREPDVIFLYPQVAYSAVARFAREKSTNIQSLTHVVRQLFEDGFMVDRMIKRDQGRLTSQRRGPGGNLVKVYPIKAEFLGFDQVSSKVKNPEPTQAQKPKTASQEDAFPLE